MKLIYTAKLLFVLFIIAIFSPGYPVITLFSSIVTVVLLIVSQFSDLLILQSSSGSVKYQKAKLFIFECFFPILLNLFILLFISSFRSMSMNSSTFDSIFRLLLSIILIMISLISTFRTLFSIFSKSAVDFSDLIKIITDIIIIICLFASLFSVINTYDSQAFCGIRSTNPYDIAVDFLYFSVVSFTTLGFGDIHPVSTLAKLFALIEPLLSTIGISIILVVFVRNLAKPSSSPITRPNKPIWPE